MQGRGGRRNPQYPRGLMSSEHDRVILTALVAQAHMLVRPAGTLGMLHRRGLRTIAKGSTGPE